MDVFALTETAVSSSEACLKNIMTKLESSSLDQSEHLLQDYLGSM